MVDATQEFQVLQLSESRTLHLLAERCLGAAKGNSHLLKLWLSQHQAVINVYLQIMSMFDSQPQQMTLLHALHVTSTWYS